MEKQLILYAGVYRYQYLLATQGQLVVAKSGLADLIVPELEGGRLSFRLDESSGQVIAQMDGGQEDVLTSGPINLAGLRLFISEVSKPQYFDLMSLSQLSLGAKSSNTITFEGLPKDPDLLLVKENEGWQLVSTGNIMMMLNNRQLTHLPQTLQFGDELAFDGLTLKFMNEELWVTGVQTSSQQLVETPSSRYDFYEDYPNYHRSPRIIYREPEDKITIKGPTDMPRKPANHLLRAIIPPLVMVGMVVLISFFQPRGIYIYIMVVTSIVTVILSITNFFKTRKEYKENVIEREVLFREYLMTKSQDLYKIQEEHRQGQLYHYPKVEELLEMASRYDHRIYEKTPLHFDFLSYRLGLGEREASFSLTYPPLDREKKLDDLEKEGLALYDQYRQTRELPIVANLMSGPVGYIGPRSVVLEQLQLLVYQLAFFHSYHDVQVITLSPEEEKDDWTWMRWLPHATLQDINVRGLVYDQRSRDQVLNSLYQVLKIRKSQRDNKEVRESTFFTPHYVVVVTDASFILDHVIMEFFNEDPTDLGCSIIFVQDTLSSLSENIVTIVDMKDRNNGILVLEKGELVNKRFRLDHLNDDFDKEAMPRLLAPLRHLQNLKNSIPERVGFLEMYGVKEINELSIPELWATHAPHQSLAVPLGMRGKDDLVYLDLHEKAHGPHGLIAGTTGSGKSELIQSYILSLALNFHPHDVGFLLIDYKGGGMANLFKDLPHLLGTITNLDAASSMRALVSIEAENKRRQAVFAKFGVNHINQYQKLYKNGEVAEPMPHLFLISDEFAELKTNEPEFMKKLVSTARIGRSLGVHLILATQKPSGVVDDQIWSNSRFKLSLKVATTQDSQELLKTADAADITQTGRAYLQVGNNEIYELFQSAYSGGDYQPDKDRLNIEDHTIYAINVNGQYDILTQDLSGLDEAETVEEIPSELDVVVKAIKATTDQLNVAPLPKPWLPPLGERIYLEELVTFDWQTAWSEGYKPLMVTLGMVDLPAEQAQKPAVINLTEDGNMALFGSPGTGKSTFLQTVFVNLVRQLTPEQLHVYLFDFGANGLAPLRSYPHVADMFLVDDLDKILKWIRRIKELIAERKRILQAQSVANIKTYNELTGEVLPAIVIILDNYDGFKDEPFKDSLESIFYQVAREGLSLGIYLVLTADRWTSIRVQLQANLKNKFALTLNDSTDLSSIVGRLQVPIRDIKGQGAIRWDGMPTIIQFALPTQTEGEMVNIAALREEAHVMSEHWGGDRPEEIPMLSESITWDDFMVRPDVQEAMATPYTFPLALDEETVTPTGLTLSHVTNAIMSNSEEERQDWIERLTILALQKEMQVIIFADDDIDLPADLLNQTIVETSIEDKKGLLETLMTRLEERKQQIIPGKPTLIIWHNYLNLISHIDIKALDKLLYQGPRYHYYSVLINDATMGRRIDIISERLKRGRQGISQLRLIDQSLFNVDNRPIREGTLAPHQVYIIKNNMAHRAIIPQKKER